MKTYTVYQYDQYSYYTGVSKEITEFDPIERRWTTVELPVIPEGQFAFFRDGGWVVTETPRPVPIIGPDWKPSSDPVFERVVPESITRRQCALELLNRQIITGAEALDMTRNGTPPTAVMTYIETLPADDQIKAQIDYAAENYYRKNQLLIAIMTANNLSSDDIDEFFINAAKL